VTARFTAHAENHKLFPTRQSASRRHHFTETVVVSVLNDIIRAADEGKVTCLVLLDLSAAFDMHCRPRHSTRCFPSLVSSRRTCSEVVPLISEQPDAGHHTRWQRVCTHSCRVQCSTGLCARAGPVYLILRRCRHRLQRTPPRSVPHLRRRQATVCIISSC